MLANGKNNRLNNIDIDKEVEKLVSNSPRMPASVYNIKDLQASLRKGDYMSVESQLLDALAHSKVANSDFFPFNSLMRSIPDAQDASFEQHINDWISKSTHKYIPYLLRAQYYTNKALETRGENFVSTISDEHMHSFSDYNTKALADVDAAIGLKDDVVFAYSLKLDVLSTGGNTAEMEKAFQQAIAKFPDYYFIYRTRLYTLTPKWGGSIDEMIEFVDKYARMRPQDSDLKLLYLRMYGYIIDAVSVSCYTPQEDERKKCASERMGQVVSPKLLTDVVEQVFALYHHKDQLEFAWSIRGALLEIISTSGSEKVVGELLQQLAQATNSDSQLDDQQHHGHNLFVVDEAAAEVWQKQKAYESAERKFEETLLDIQNGSQANPGLIAQLNASIHQEIASMYFDMGHYAEAIVHQRVAEILLEAGRFSFLECNAYFQLRNYDEAERQCTELIKETNSERARQTLAKIYEVQHKDDLAIADLKTLADSESNWRSWAAIEMTVIYGHHNEFQKQLDVLNRYTFLYDQSSQMKESLAVAYNNRCYAYLHLGDLQKAKDDCNTSLTYGNLPDAYQKLHEIDEKMKAKAH